MILHPARIRSRSLHLGYLRPGAHQFLAGERTVPKPDSYRTGATRKVKSQVHLRRGAMQVGTYNEARIRPDSNHEGRRSDPKGKADGIQRREAVRERRRRSAMPGSIRLDDWRDGD